MREAWRNETFEAPTELVEPTQQVVMAAMGRLQEGKVDSLGRQRILLQNTKYGKLYAITNGQVEQTSDGVKSIGSLDSGLFISELILDEADSTIRWGLRIQAPRTPDSVDPRRIYSLRFIQPETMDILAKELTEATIILPD